MRFCSNCGKEIKDEDLVCPYCGNRVQQGAPAGSSPAPQPAAYSGEQPRSAAPVGQLRTNRGLLKFILLSLITFGIYGIVVMSDVSTDINTIASRYDGRRTMHYCLVCFVFSWLFKVFDLIVRVNY